MLCHSCDAMHINGILCHEHGCPDSWQDETRECKWCGTEFVPSESGQEFCDTSCYCAYNGLPCEDDCDGECVPEYDGYDTFCMNDVAGCKYNDGSNGCTRKMEVGNA